MPVRSCDGVATIRTRALVHQRPSPRAFPTLVLFHAFLGRLPGCQTPVTAVVGEIIALLLFAHAVSINGCSKDTGGTCSFFSCDSSRKSTCVSSKCVCGTGECAINGKCERTPIVGHRPWARGSWAGSGSRAMGHGLWTAGCGKCFMGHGP